MLVQSHVIIKSIQSRMENQEFLMCPEVLIYFFYEEVRGRCCLRIYLEKFQMKVHIHFTSSVYNYKIIHNN